MIIYIKAKRIGNVQKEKVKVSDICDVYCDNDDIKKAVEHICIYEFAINSKHQTYRSVITIMDVIASINRRIADADVISLGETETLVEYDRSSPPAKWIEGIKLVLVCILVFFGAAFTIMAFNNDISIQGVFDLFYFQVVGKKKPDISELEIAYSLGMAVGIIVFFNHVGRKRITNDMTPIEVEFDKHKKDIYDAMIDNVQDKER